MKAVTAAVFADRLDYTLDTFWDLVNNGDLPGPINDRLAKRSWRWSPVIVADYINGVEAAA